MSSRSVPVQRDRPTSDICFSKVGSLAFIAMVINCTTGMEHKSLNIGGSCKELFGSEELQGVNWWCPNLLGCWLEVGLKICI